MLLSARSRSMLLALLAIAVLAFAGSAAAANERSLAAKAPNDALSRALASGQITGAQYSLQRALAILAQPRRQLARPRRDDGAPRSQGQFQLALEQRPAPGDETVRAAVGRRQ